MRPHITTRRLRVLQEAGRVPSKLFFSMFLWRAEQHTMSRFPSRTQEAQRPAQCAVVLYACAVSCGSSRSCRPNVWPKSSCAASHSSQELHSAPGGGQSPLNCVLAELPVTIQHPDFFEHCDSSFSIINMLIHKCPHNCTYTYFICLRVLHEAGSVPRMLAHG